MTKPVSSSFTIRPSMSSTATPFQRATTIPTSTSMHHQHLHSHHHTHHHGYYGTARRNVNYPNANPYNAAPQDHGMIVQFRDNDRHRVPPSLPSRSHEAVVSSGSTSGGASSTRYHPRDSSLKRRLFHDPVGDETAAASRSATAPLLRASPFEPLVHERNLPYNGTISTMRHSRYCRPDNYNLHHPHPNVQSPWDPRYQEHHQMTVQRAAFEPPMDDTGEIRWKRRCYQLQRELNDTRNSMRELKEEHQHLKRRYVKLEESWLLLTNNKTATKSSNTDSSSPLGMESFNTGDCVLDVNNRNRRQPKLRQQDDNRGVAPDESSPVSVAASSNSCSNHGDGDPDTESKILASAAKAVTQDIPDDDEEEARLPTLVHVPIRADGQIVCHADDEALSDDEGDVDAISLEDMDSEASFVGDQQQGRPKKADNDPHDHGHFRQNDAEGTKSPFPGHGAATTREMHTDDVIEDNLPVFESASGASAALDQFNITTDGDNMYDGHQSLMLSKKIKLEDSTSVVPV